MNIPDPTTGNIPARADNYPKEAKRLAVHSEDVKNNLKPINQSQPKGSWGKIGVMGSGRDK